MGKLELVDTDLIKPTSGNRSHLERALFHFQLEHIILLCTRLFHLHLECTLPVPKTIEALLFCFCHPIQVPEFCFLLHLLLLLLLLFFTYMLYLRSLIQATSWSGAGPDLICCQREACLWADGPLWSCSSSSSSYKLASFSCCLYMGPAASCSLFTRPLSSFNCCLFNLVAFISLISQNWSESEELALFCTCCLLVLASS